MNYTNGTPVKVGDIVGLGEDRNGRVGVFTDAHPREQWGYLRVGVMIEFPTWGLIHYETPEPGLNLISRAER